MTLARGRVLRCPTDAVPLASDATRPAPRGTRMPREVLEARERADATVRAAEHAAAEIRLRAEERGRATGLAEAAALAVKLRARELGDDAALDRSVALARLLAERLLGHSLSVSPDTIVSLARQALTEASGARRVTLAANPLDAPALRAALASLDPERRVHSIVDDENLGRGDLRLETELGVVDAHLGPELDRLATRLREALEK